MFRREFGIAMPDPNSHIARRLRRCVVSLILFAITVCGGTAAADEPVNRFLDALRTAGYYDTALEYIDQQQQNPVLAEELKQSLAFERAMTLLGQSRTARTSGVKAKALAEAQTSLESFARTYQRHPLAARANSELGTLLLERANTAKWQAQSPPAGRTKQDMQAEARSILAQARDIYGRAFQQWDAKLKAMPSYIGDDEDLQEQYREVQIAQLKSKLNLTKCTLIEGQTYDRGTPKRTEVLKKAAEEFKGIHEEYRQELAGIVARLYQGKSFEEQDDIKRALGIYNEVQSHKHPEIAPYAIKAKLFRLICLNHPAKKSYELAINESGAWLDANRKSRTTDAVAIRWEKSRAHEFHANTLPPENPERRRNLQLALSEATDVARYSSPYKDIANSAVRRLKAELGMRSGPPKDFDTAFGLAQSSIRRITALKTALAKATAPADRRKAKEDLRLEVEKTDDLLTTALELGARKKSEDVQARYLLSFIKFERGRPFDAIVLAQHVMTYSSKDVPQTAQDAAEVAMVACVRAFNEADEGKRDAEIQMLEWICGETVRLWPASDRANEARMSLGMLNKQSGKLEEASKWYNAVPKEASQYGAAQLEAGKAWWRASLNATRATMQGTDYVPAERVYLMKDNAEKHIREGLRASFNPAAAPTAAVIGGKLSLAELLSSKGEFNEAIKLLTEGKQSIMGAVRVADESKRPEKGVTSKDFASSAYRLLLRAYVGTQQIDNAIAAMSELEKIGGQDTRIYVQLGRQLQDEIETLKTEKKPERLAQLRTSFEQFLEKVFQRKESQNYNSLIWIGETYRGLGLGLSDDPTAAGKYFKRAAESYQTLLDKNLVDNPGRQMTVELRVISCRRNLGDYESAMKDLVAFLAKHPQDLNGQFEACHLLREWGNKATEDKLRQSIGGIKDQGIWGWIGLGERLRSPKFRDKFLESRFGLVESRRDFGLKAQGEKRQQRLKQAIGDLQLIASTSGDVEEPWWGQFQGLNAKLHQDLNIPVVELMKPEKIKVVEAPAAKEPEPAEPTPEPQVEEPPQVEKKETNTALALGGALVVALLAAGGMWFGMSKPRKKNTAQQYSGPEPTFDNISVAQTKKPRPGGPGDRQKPRAKPQGQGGPPGKPATGKPGAKKPGTRKKQQKPKPPQET